MTIKTADIRRDALAYLDQVAEIDTPERVRARVGLVFEMFYDDELDEPDQAIRDALTDLMHEAAARGVDFEDALGSALRMWAEERKEWADRKASE